MMVHPQAADAYLLPLPRGVRHHRAAAGGISTDGRRGEVALRGGGRLPFDYAVLALGSRYPPFKTADAGLTLTERRAAFGRLRGRIAAAESIVVVGGGNVGVELAAEIADAPEFRRQGQQGRGDCGGGKRLTVVAGPFDRLLPRMAPKAGGAHTRARAGGAALLLPCPRQGG